MKLKHNSSMMDGLNDVEAFLAGEGRGVAAEVAGSNPVAPPYFSSTRRRQWRTWGTGVCIDYADEDPTRLNELFTE